MIKSIIANIKLWIGQKDLQSAHVKLSTCGYTMTECLIEEHGNSVTFHTSSPDHVRRFLLMFNDIKDSMGEI